MSDSKYTIYGNKYTIYGKPSCVYCERAKELLKSFGKEYNYIDVEEDIEALDFIVSNGFKTVPQIFMQEVHIGGFEDLKTHLVTT